MYIPVSQLHQIVVHALPGPEEKPSKAGKSEQLTQTGWGRRRRARRRRFVSFNDQVSSIRVYGGRVRRCYRRAYNHCYYRNVRNPAEIRQKHERNVKNEGRAKHNERRGKAERRAKYNERRAKAERRAKVYERRAKARIAKERRDKAMKRERAAKHQERRAKEARNKYKERKAKAERKAKVSEKRIKAERRGKSERRGKYNERRNKSIVKERRNKKNGEKKAKVLRVRREKATKKKHVKKGFKKVCTRRCHSTTRCTTPCSVTVYKHCIYGGYRINLKPGSYNMHALMRRGMKNDDLSSIRVHGRCVAKMYQHHNFGGKVMTKSSSDSCFTNDRMYIPVSQLHQIVVHQLPEPKKAKKTSPVNMEDGEDVKMENLAETGAKNGAKHHIQRKRVCKRLYRKAYRTAHRWSHRWAHRRVCHRTSCSVDVFKHCNYRGYRIHLTPGNYNAHTLMRKGMRNDDLSSIRVNGRCVARLYQHINFGGRVLTKTGNDSRFTNDRMYIPLSQLHQLVIHEAPEPKTTKLVQVGYRRRRRRRRRYSRRRSSRRRARRHVS